MSVQEEILGGDLHYFGPIKFKGKLSDYDTNENLKEIIQKQVLVLKQM